MTSREAEILRFRGYCCTCGARTVRRGYRSRKCKRLGAALRRVLCNGGCRTLAELVERTPPGERVFLDLRNRTRP